MRRPAAQVIELKQPMTPRMVAIQEAILTSMRYCLDELRKYVNGWGSVLCRPLPSPMRPRITQSNRLRGVCVVVVRQSGAAGPDGVLPRVGFD